MSGYTMTQMELLYCCAQASTPVTTPTVSPGASMMPGLPPIQVPAGYMKNGTGTMASSLCLKIWGLLTATATVPTYGFSLSYTSSNTWAGTPLLATATSAIPAPTAGTAPFYMQYDIAYRTPNPLGAGASPTGVVVASGYIVCPLFATTQGAAGTGLVGGMAFMPPSGTLGNATAWDPNVAYYLWPTIFCGAATALNSVTTEIVKLYGEN